MAVNNELFGARDFEQSGAGVFRADVSSRKYKETGRISLRLYQQIGILDDAEEALDLTVYGRLKNPLALSIATSYLGGVGWCLAPKVISIFVEALSNSYDETKPKGSGAWYAPEERADQIARRLFDQRSKIKAKFLAAASQCILPWK